MGEYGSLPSSHDLSLNREGNRKDIIITQFDIIEECISSLASRMIQRIEDTEDESNRQTNECSHICTNLNYLSFFIRKKKIKIVMVLPRRRITFIYLSAVHKKLNEFKKRILISLG